MAVATFDTLKFSKALREAGVPEKQADAEAAVLSEVFSINFRELATKDDLRTEIRVLRDELKADIAAVKVEMRAMEERFDHKLKDMEQRLTTKFDLLKSDFTLVKWMLGVNTTAVLAIIGIAVRVFLFPK